MTKNDIIILGSGMSILDLSAAEIEYINQCSVRIAVNKFMAFYKKVNIMPTHVYYVDAYEKSVVLFLQHIFNVCRKDKLENLTFILGKHLNQKKVISNLLYFYLKKNYLKFKKIDNVNLFLVPKNCFFEFISHQDWLHGNEWSHTLKQPLFHYRGSLSTVLNYVSIKYPNHPIKLVGVDFNSPDYFFQKELEKLNFAWQDWTTPIIQKEKNHFSAIPYEGTTIFDKFEFIIENLHKSGNEIFSCNPNGLLVSKNLVKYNKIIS
ncbi:hypothetical protein Sta7437_2605 [Stanieria cyanosphaera PCC 7437]|uniref:Uncharacterized protein n=1 Tax=Stanieria cyanosphaera (strain ATCC 29371 / PCC 7437) TaxID=111780 RepID=K9XVM4_STAC7|nr:hypothetical protein [Stanieria cyanosphaera]AFZ36136.1 hypothetical protein Sta7437_2605 [Stanieria cyanosphaera PCC 7437]